MEVFVCILFLKEKRLYVFKENKVAVSQSGELGVLHFLSPKMTCTCQLDHKVEEYTQVTILSGCTGVQAKADVEL